ncbi:class I SAM-dependent methyltransferase [Lachnospiraceae bacterium OttesenSCG-928-D06]|nr:class I SAM-dependent methyltransferase [Lachnospiraceae bacterium OttesenSCG-928-D06]
MADGNDKIEKIGKVTLNYNKYPGEDFYCDGEVEEELLSIVKTHPAEEYAGIIEERKSWPILYHLSPLRENIVEWIPIEPGAKVLEVGSGCGAITGALAKKAGTVTCVDLSKKRSLINAHRHSEYDNITIHVGNFKEVEPDLETDYDYICLIGVFEYGQAYIGGNTPYEDFLSILLRHLSDSGRIIIAIENKYGLKYFAGCKEDHVGTYFSGIEGYKEGGDARTFGRSGLEKIFKACKVSKYHFYYPYPDYKFMTTLYSEGHLPEKGELSNNARNFDRDRMLLFDESAAFDGIIEEGLFSVFSNSYAVVLGRDFDVEYVKYSNDRAKEFQIKTQINRISHGEPIVCKCPLSDTAISHIQGMEIAYEKLYRRYKGGNLKINRCKMKQDREGNVFARFEFVEGTLLSKLMDECLDNNDQEGFQKLFCEYVERIAYNEEEPVADFDMVFSNIIVNKNRWTLIDYEWTFGKRIPTKELAFRAVYCYLLEDEKRNKLNLDFILERLGITTEEAEAYKEQELDFQKFVTGQRYSMSMIRELIGKRMIVPQKFIDKYEDSELVNRVQVYEDKGEGFIEEESYFIKDAYMGENRIEMNLTVFDDVRLLRIDPSMDSCVVKITEMTWNGEVMPLKERGFLRINGRIAKENKNSECYQPTLIFSTKDPNINISLEKMKKQQENNLYVKMEIIRMPSQIACDLEESAKKWYSR